MSLIIQPVKSIDFQRIDVGAVYTCQEYDGFYYVGWIRPTLPDWYGGHPVRDELGWRWTTKSGIRNQNHCDNLQLSGSVFDYTSIPGFKLVPTSLSYFPFAYQTPNGLDFHVSMIGNGICIQPCTAVAYTNPRRKGAAGCILSDFDRLLCCRFKGTLSGPSEYSSIPHWNVGAFEVVFYEYDAQNQIQYLYGFMEYGITTQDILLQRVSTWRTRLEGGWSPTNSYRAVRPRYSWSSAFSDNYLQTRYNRQMPNWITTYDKWIRPSYDFGDLHYRALCKIPVLRTNVPQLLKDLRHPLQEVASAIKALRRPTPKKVADLFLSWKYGLPQTVSDLTSIKEHAPASKKSAAALLRGAIGVSATDEIVSPDGSYQKYQTTIRLVPKDSTPLTDLFLILSSVGAAPDFHTLWELVPFSFVLDWFLNVDRNLTRLDMEKFIENYEIVAVFDTIILQGIAPPASFGIPYLGPISYRYYNRNVSKDAHFPLIVPTSPSASSHWLEGIALIIQRLF